MSLQPLRCCGRPNRTKDCYLKKRIVIVLLVLVGLAAVSSAAVRFFFPAEKVRDMIAGRAGAALGLKITLGDVSPSLFPAGVKVKQVVVENPSAGAPPLLDMREAELFVRLLPLLSRRIELSRVGVDGAVITIVKEADAGEDARREGGPGGGPDGPEEKSAGSPFALLLPDASLRDVTLRYIDRETNDELLLEGVAASTSLRAAAGGGPVIAEGKIEAKTIRSPRLARLGYAEGIGGLEIRYRGGYDPEGGSATIDDVDLSLAGLSFQVGGRLSGLPDRPEGRITIDAPELESARLLELLPPAVTAAKRFEASGPLSLDGEVRLSPEGSPEFLGSVVFGGIALSDADHPRLMGNLRGQIEATGSGMKADDLRFDLSGSPSTLSLAVSDPAGSPHVTFDFGTTKIDFDALLLPPEGGDGAARQADGPPGSSGAVPPVVLPPLPPVGIDGLLKADTLITGGNRLVETEARLRVGRDGRGTLHLTMGTGLFDGVRIREAEGDLVVEDGLLTGEITADSAVTYRVPLSSLRGRIAIDPAGERVKLNDLQANVYRGFVAGDAEIRIPAGDGDPTWKLTARAESLEANDFLSDLTPVRDVLFGRFRMESSWEGSGLAGEEIAQILEADGTMEAVDGEIRNLAVLERIGALLGIRDVEVVRFRKFWSNFSVAGGRVLFDGIEIRSADADWSADGSVGFDGSLDYRVTAILSEEISRKYREKSSLTSLISNADGRVVLDFLLTGTSKSPVVTYDLARAAERTGVPGLGDLIEDLGGDEKVQEAIDGLLNGKNPFSDLFGGKKKDK